MSIHDYTGLDVEAALADANEHELWRAHLLGREHATWDSCLRAARRKGDASGIASSQRYAAKLPPLTAIQELVVTTRLTALLEGFRWHTMMRAREQGASWDEIGAAMDTTDQVALDWYRHAIEEQERYVGDLHDAARARAALRDSKEN